MRARTVAGLLAILLVAYMAFVGARALVLIADGRPATVGLGVALLVFPVLTALLVWREFRFGVRVQRLADHLAQTSSLPLDDLPKRPSGRPVRAAADERFRVRKAEVEAAPSDPGAWFRLSVAYDDAGDRKRARAAMRQAVALFDGLSERAPVRT